MEPLESVEASPPAEAHEESSKSRHAPRPLTVWVLIVAHTLVFFGLYVFGWLSWDELVAPRSSPGVFEAVGGMVRGPGVVADPLAWLSCIALHGGLIHLIPNMIGLLGLGSLLERLLGPRYFLLVFVGSGITGSVLSFFVSQDRTVSVGASGAIVGCGAAAVVVFIRFRKQLGTVAPAWFLGLMLVGILGVLPLLDQMFQQHFGFRVDHLGHAGGALGGFLLGWVPVRWFAPRAPGARFMASLLGGVLGLIFLLPIYLMYSGPLDPEEQFEAMVEISWEELRLSASVPVHWQPREGEIGLVEWHSSEGLLVVDQYSPDTRRAPSILSRENLLQTHFERWIEAGEIDVADEILRRDLAGEAPGGVLLVHRLEKGPQGQLRFLRLMDLPTGAVDLLLVLPDSDRDLELGLLMMERGVRLR